MVSFLDDNIGQVLTALERSGLAANTRVIYGLQAWVGGLARKPGWKARVGALG